MSFTTMSNLLTNNESASACPGQVKEKDGEMVGVDSLRIMRSHLRRSLLSRVPLEAVQFGKVCMSAEPAASPGQPVQMTFADGSSEECDLLVVADGANSKLRAALLPHEVNRYAGVCMLYVSPHARWMLLRMPVCEQAMSPCSWAQATCTPMHDKGLDPLSVFMGMSGWQATIGESCLTSRCHQILHLSSIFLTTEQPNHAFGSILLL